MNLSQAKAPLTPTPIYSVPQPFVGEFASTLPVPPPPPPPPASTYVALQPAQMPAPMPMAHMPPPALPPRCPHCGSTAPPIFRKNRWKQWCCCVILLFTLPFVSWAPFCVDSCADREMYCPQCLRVRKSYNPIMQTEAVFM